MTRLVRTVAAAALALTALAAAPARACDDHREHRHATPPAAYVPPPVRAPVPVRISWREAALRDLRRDYRELEHKRGRFYATWNGSPGKQRKFERWYAQERWELDRRSARLNAIAWR
jgi:hypothetical protein